MGGYAAVADGCIGQASDVHPDGRGVQLRGSHSRRGSDMPEQPSVDTDRWQLWQPGMRM